MNYWIVVVDDEVLSLTNAKILLSQERIRVNCLRSGRHLLEFIKKNTPDLIILDILMPDMDGFETYYALRQYENASHKPHIPVIFLTGENDVETEQKCLKIGASDFIRKPFNKEVLIKRVQNTISNSKTIQNLTEEATIDQLTGFLNKANGTSRITQMCSDSFGSLMILDLDSFKLVNDLFGHDMGDRILQSFSNIIRNNTRVTDVISRIGGDEFLGFFENVVTETAVSSLSERLNNQLSDEAANLMGESNGIPLGISIGAVVIPEHGREFDSLFALADHELQKVKQNGKHGYSIYDKSSPKEYVIEDDLDLEITRLTQIIEERNEKKGALMLGREAFSDIYRFILRFYKRYGGSLAKVLFELSAPDDEKETLMPQASTYLENLLTDTLRRSDLIMQNRPNQFFVCLNESSNFEAINVIKRIISIWTSSSYSEKVKIRYSYQYTEYPAKER